MYCYLFIFGNQILNTWLLRKPYGVILVLSGSGCIVLLRFSIEASADPLWR